MGEELNVSERFENKEEKLVPPTWIERATRGLGNPHRREIAGQRNPAKTKGLPWYMARLGRLATLHLVA